MKKDHTLNLFFKAKKKGHENFSIQFKTDHQKFIFEAKKNWESVESNFYKQFFVEKSYILVDA